MKCIISLLRVVAFLLLVQPLSAQSLGEAEALMEQKDYKGAEQVLQKLTAAEPNNTAAILLLGQSLYHQEKFDEAVKQLKPLKSKLKSDADYFYWLGQSYKGKLLATDNFLEKGVLSSKVKEYLEKSIVLNPEQVDARESIAFFYFSAPGIVGGSTKKAFREVEEIKKRDKKRGLILAGNLYRQQKDYPSAIETYQALMALEQENANWYLLLGSAYQLNKDYDLAFQFLEQALQKKETLAAAYYQYARTGVLTKKKVDQSIAYMQQFLSLNDKASYPPASAYWRLGMLYEIKGQQEKAKAAYQKGLTLDPKHEQLQKAMAELKQ